MALDGFYLNAITKELRNKLEGSRCDKISQPEKDEIILSFKNRNGSYKVLLTSATDSARVHLTDITKQNPMQAPLFTMVLRKYLQGGKLKNIHQLNGDRILIFEFEASDELGFSSVYKLICEMMGKHSNIILVRERDNKIVECIKHISHDMNTYRLLLPGAEYISPPDQNKLDPSNYYDEALIPWLTEELDSHFFMRRFTGVSKKTSERLLSEVKKKCPINNDSKIMSHCIREVLNDALNTNIFYCFMNDEIPVDISLIPPADTETIESDEIKEFSSPSECLEYYISSKDLVSRVRERSADILRVVSGNIDRVEKKLSILNNVLEEAGEKDKLLIQGELLKANLYTLPEGESTARVLNYYSEKEEYMDINLDPNKTVSENMQTYFKKYNKLKRSEENALDQIILANEELSYLNSVSESIQKSEDPADIAEIKNELIVAGYIRYKSTKKKKESPSKPMQFVSSEGYSIFVGKNNNQNDYLTTKFAAQEDTWLHTKNYPGSHVIIKGKGFNEETLLEAANLAAYFSKASGGTKVQVDYTLIKYVKKPSGSKPGMVTYSTNKSVFIDPDSPRVKRV